MLKSLVTEEVPKFFPLHAAKIIAQFLQLIYWSLIKQKVNKYARNHLLMC